MKFIDYFLYNFLIGNADAHAKNFSIVEVGGRRSIAPIYDAMSTVVYPNVVNFPPPRQNPPPGRSRRIKTDSYPFWYKLKRMSVRFGIDAIPRIWYDMKHEKVSETL